jgi:hypothetical protein
MITVSSKSTRTTTGTVVFQAFEYKWKMILTTIATEMVNPRLEGLGRFVVVTLTEGL